MKVKTFSISISIEEFSEEEAIEELKRVTKEISEYSEFGGRGSECSAHPAEVEPYLPYTWYSCREIKQEISWEWLGTYNAKERKKMMISIPLPEVKGDSFRLDEEWDGERPPCDVVG